MCQFALGIASCVIRSRTQCFSTHSERGDQYVLRGAFCVLTEATSGWRPSSHPRCHTVDSVGPWAVTSVW